MSIADQFAIALAPESDEEFFLDRRRRCHRFRAAFPGEASVPSRVFVKRERGGKIRRFVLAGAPTAEALEMLRDDEWILGITCAALERAGYPAEPETKTPAVATTTGAS